MAILLARRLAAAGTLASATLGAQGAGALPAVAAAAPATLRVVALGDSITWGVGSSKGNGYRGPQSGHCPDAPGSSTADGTRLQLHDCNGTNAQRWTALQQS
jgi:lysophospholipase L1-like esterase